MRIVLSLVCLILCLHLPACTSGPKPIKVTGKLNYKDQPLKVDPKGGVTLSFIQAAEDDKPSTTYNAEINRDDMTFVVKSRDPKGIPPGKYRIAVNLMMPEQTAQVQEINQRFSPQDTKIERDITTEEPIVLDLSKPEGK